jgi:Tfp pilus assembly protein PilN
MPAAPKILINLLGQEQQEHSPLGRFIGWATTYGRYIMVTTEVIVLIAFLSRFSLDRQLTDLKDEIQQKQDIIAANQDLEIDFRQTQDSLNKIKALLAKQEIPTNTINTLRMLLPSGTYFQSLSIENNNITSQVVSVTVQSFSQFLINLSATKQLSNIEIGTVDKQTIAGIQYTLSAQLAQALIKK